ncbi:hypothetical protein B0H11DRAFT_2222094 [Mycena galericulata]|nr:hypothetical protein B0H11DRAFT_2222094 [Mycena galericulata]
MTTVAGLSEVLQILTLPNIPSRSITRQLNKLAQTDPEAAAKALFNTWPYLPKAGLCYVQCSINDPAYSSIATVPPDVEIDYIDIKIGETKEIVQRCADYEAKCKGKHFA